MTAMQVRNPNLFVIGAPKCATTYISHYLSMSQQVYMSEEYSSATSPGNPDIPYAKEPEFYTFDAEDIFGERQIKVKDDYLELFNSAPKDVKWLGDASPHYLCSKKAIPRILEDCSKSRFIVSLRDPAEIAFKIHAERVRRGSESIQDFETAWRAQGERMKGRKLPYRSNKTANAFQYGKLANVGDQLERLYRVVPRERVFVTTVSALKTDAPSELRSLCGFLGIDYIDPPSVKANSGTRPRSLTLAKALYVARSLRKRLGVTSLGLGGASRFVRTLNQTRVPLTPTGEFRDELDSFFAPQRDRLLDLTGLVFRSWE